MVDLSGFAEPLKGLPTVSVNPLAGLLCSGQQRSDTPDSAQAMAGPSSLCAGGSEQEVLAGLWV